MNSFLLSAFFLVAGCSSTGESEKLQITDSEASIAIVDSEQIGFNKQKSTYEITIVNPNDVKAVDYVDVIPTKIIKDRLVDTKYRGIESW